MCLCVYVPFNLKGYAESILPVTSIDMQALCTRNDSGARARAITYRPVVNNSRTQTSSSIRVYYNWLILVWTEGRVEKVQVAEVELSDLYKRGGGSYLEIGHGDWWVGRGSGSRDDVGLWDASIAVCDNRKVGSVIYR